MRNANLGWVFCASLIVGCGLDPTPTSTETPQALGVGDEHAHRHFQHVFYVMMENHGTDEIIGNTAAAPFINTLADQYGVAMNYYGVTHPSLPNYLSAISGSFQGIWDDCKAGADVTCAPEEFVPDSGDATDTLLLTPEQIASASATPHMFGGKNLVDRLEARDLTWRAYMQSIPGGRLDRRILAVRRDHRGAAQALRAEAQPVRILLRHPVEPGTHEADRAVRTTPGGSRRQQGAELRVDQPRRVP